MKRIISIVLIMTLALSISMTAFAGSDTKTATTSGGSKAVKCTFTLTCTKGGTSSYDKYTLKCSNTTADKMYYYHEQIVSTTVSGTVSYISAAMSELTDVKTWQDGTGAVNTMYSSSTQARVAAGSFGTTSNVQLAARY